MKTLKQLSFLFAILSVFAITGCNVEDVLPEPEDVCGDTTAQQGTWNVDAYAFMEYVNDTLVINDVTSSGSFAFNADGNGTMNLFDFDSPMTWERIFTDGATYPSKIRITSSGESYLFNITECDENMQKWDYDETVVEGAITTRTHITAEISR